MPTVLLVRHGRSDANAAKVLAGRAPGIELDAAGRDEVNSLAARLTKVPLTAVISSPLERCVQTAQALANGRTTLDVVTDERFIECDYGEWTGRPLHELSRTKLWKQVQTHPSAATFPGGESMRAMQDRMVQAIREHDSRIADRSGKAAIWAAVSHADVIKAVVADALGMHLDLFQRLVIDPASVTVINYSELRPFVTRLNDTGGELAELARRRRRRRPSNGAVTDAVVGGGDGSE